MSRESSSRPIVGLSTLLGVAFIVLKLCGVIDWHWGWVLSPFWIPLVLTVVFLLIAGFIALAVSGVRR